MQKNNGFTLVEVVIALALAGAVIAALSGAFMQSTSIQKQLAGRVEAVVLGQGKLVELQHGIEPSNSGNFAEPYQRYRWFSEEEELENGIYQLKLTVEWREQNGPPRQKVFKGYRFQQ